MQSLPSTSIFTISSNGFAITLSETVKRWSIGVLLSEIGADAPQNLLETEHGQLIALRRAWRLVASQWKLASERAALCGELERRAKMVLTPATRPQITTRIQALLAHYFRTDDPLAVQAMALDDWVTVLEGSPYWSIDVACKEWISDPKTARTKPLPADIKSRLRHAEPQAEPVRTYRTFDPAAPFSKSSGDPDHDAKIKAETEEMLAQLRRRVVEERKGCAAPRRNFCFRPKRPMHRNTSAID